MMNVANYASLGDVVVGVVDLISLVINSIEVFFLGVAYSFEVVLNFINDLPTVISYGIQLSISITLSILVINTLKGLIG